MKHIHTIKSGILALVMALSLVGAPAAFADTPPPSTSSQASSTGSCGDTKTEFIRCEESSGLGSIGALIKIAIFVVTVIIGIAAVGGLGYAAILYSAARDNQGQVSEARTIIRNVVIGLVLYGFAIAIINMLVPGGVIG